MFEQRRKYVAKRPHLTPCGYCFQEWATLWDHIVPISRKRDNRPENLYPSCERCNLILSDKVFHDGLDGKRRHIREVLTKRGLWIESEDGPD